MKGSIVVIAFVLMSVFPISTVPAGDDYPNIVSTSYTTGTAVLSLGDSNSYLRLTTVEASDSSKRIVRVYVVDPNPNVPIEDSLLYKMDEQFTDKTDRELYFDIPIKDLLKKHNAKRERITDKDGKFLKAAKIRDLKMVVVKIAEF
jgi:hypothetical protein